MSYDYFAGIGKTIANPPFGEVEGWTVQYHLRAALGDKDGATELRSQWQEQTVAKGKDELGWVDETLGQIFAQPKIELNMLQPYSFYISLTFTLRKPYLSKDDNEFYIIDNPVRKDPIFKLPMVAPTAWKGALRAALWMQEEKDNDNDDSSVSRLFGDAHGEDGGQQGYLFFYPTFFNRVGLEIINPHDRERRVGTNPILLECVPETTSGTFTLLYVPFDLIGKDDAITEVARDLHLVAEGVRAMFTEYGIGAKTSSGFGVAAEDLQNGVLTIRVLDEAQDKAETFADEPELASDLPRYLSAPDQLHPDFLNPAGALKSEDEYGAFVEGQGQKYKKKDSQLYAKARQWWETEGQQLAGETETSEPEPPAAEAEDIRPVWWSRDFDSFKKLLEIAEDGANYMKKQEGKK